MDLQQLFFDGQFQACYEQALTMPHDEFAQQCIQLFERFELGNVPKRQQPAIHSVERADETYAEQDDVARIRLIRDEAAFHEEVKRLETAARDGEPAEKAQAFYTQGYLFLYAHQYDESVYCFMQAAKYAPNRAVFFGIAAQTMHRFNWSPMEVMGYLEHAIALDNDNARWYWNKALVLIQLFKDLQQDAFLENAIIALETAKATCRPEQKSLAQAIESTFDTIRELVLQ